MVLSPFFLLACSSAPLPFADHWVGPPGSGQPFTDPQAAVAAAAPGDRIFLLPGTYGPVVVDKPVQLTGYGSTATRVLGTATQPAVTLIGNGSLGRVRLTGLELGLPAELETSPPALLLATGIAGSLELCDLRVQRGAHDAHPAGQGYLTFLSCDRVYASSLRMLTDAGPAGADLGGVPLAAVHAEDSNLWFSDCRLEGSGPATDAGAVEVAGANGVQVFDSLLYLALADVHAGERSGPVGLLRSGAALAATRSQVILHGGKTNHLRGGAATVDGPGGELLAGAALVLDGQSQGTWGADVDFAPGGGPGGQVQLAVEAATGAALDPRADRLPSMWIPNPNPPLGEFQAVLLEGDPGAIQFWWLTLASGPSIHIPGIEGPLVMDLGLVVSHAPVVLNEDGLGTDTAWAPPDPVLGGLVLAYQSLEFDGTRLQFAPPWFITFAFL